MKLVKIIKASKSTYWYVKEIGNYLEIYSHLFNGMYRAVGGDDKGPMYINVEDCVEMTIEDLEILKEFFEG